MGQAIRIVDIEALDAAAGPARDAMDRALGEAAEGMGFLVVTGTPLAEVTDPARIEALLRLFSLPEGEKHRLLTRRYEPENANGYRGFFSIRKPDPMLHTEGFDLGPGRPPGDGADAVEQYLMEPNVWPAEDLLPGWRTTVERHYAALDRVGRLLMQAFARHLGWGEAFFDRYFRHGPSTLRFLHVPPRPDITLEQAEPNYRGERDGAPWRLSTPSHRDSGVLTLLWQPGGLQAQAPDGRWLDAPAAPQSLTINFGDCLEFWTGGRLRATPHRVLAAERSRYSIPFFFEPDVNARIAPVGAAAEGVRYGDHVMAKIRGFGTHADLKREAR